MTIPTRKQARVDSLYIWERLEEIESDAPRVVSNLKIRNRIKEFRNELAHNIKVDTGLTPEEILAAEDQLSEALDTLNLVIDQDNQNA